MILPHGRLGFSPWPDHPAPSLASGHITWHSKSIQGCKWKLTFQNKMWGEKELFFQWKIFSWVATSCTMGAHSRLNTDHLQPPLNSRWVTNLGLNDTSRNWEVPALSCSLFLVRIIPQQQQCISKSLLSLSLHIGILRCREVKRLGICAGELGTSSTGIYLHQALLWLVDHAVLHYQADFCRHCSPAEIAAKEIMGTESSSHSLGVAHHHAHIQI